MTKEEAVAKEQPKLSKEEEAKVAEINLHQKKLQEYFETVVMPGLKQQEIRFDVVEAYAENLLKALIQIEKGKSKQWKEYLAKKKEMDEGFYLKTFNQLEYVEKV